MRLLISLFFLIYLTFTSVGQTPFFPQWNFQTMKWHYVDVNGENALEIPFGGILEMKPFCEGLAAVKDSASSHWGFINTSGKWVIDPQYDEVHDFVDGYAIVGTECKENCNQNRDGLLSNVISNIIDKKGKVAFTDNSQSESPSERFFLDENLGVGLFRVTMGYGYNDMKNIINLKGNFLCETYSVFNGSGNIIYEKELKAYKCANKFYKTSGEMLLDLSKYFFVYPFSEGYAWVNLEEDLGEDQFITWNILVDQKGKEILKLNNAEYNWPEAVENGAFVYMNPSGEPHSYNLAEKKSVPFIAETIESPVEVFPGKKLANGCRLLYTNDSLEELTGFVNKNGNVFFLVIF